MTTDLQASVRNTRTVPCMGLAYTDDTSVLYHGDALAELAALPSDSVGAVVTDPPYSSGGLMRADRTLDPNAKYVSSGAATPHASFGGDNRDQRSYGYWSTLWLGECLRIAEPGALCCVFTDWRQLSTTTDALQAGGWIFRGIVTWHKTSGRPMRGGFRNQSEFVVFGSKGPMRKDYEWYGPGVITTPIARGIDKLHVTGKPVALMQEIVRCAPPGSTVLDPFAGSGSTGVAAVLEGRRFIGIEQSEHYCKVTAERLAQAPLPLAG